MVWITPVLEDSHDPIAQVSIVLVLVLLLCAQEHVSHCVVHVFLEEVLDLQKHCDDLRFLEAVVYFFFLGKDSVVYHVGFL